MIFKDSPLESLVKTTKWDWSKYHKQSNKDKLEDIQSTKKSAYR